MQGIQRHLILVIQHIQTQYFQFGLTSNLIILAAIIPERKSCDSALLKRFRDYLYKFRFFYSVQLKIVASDLELTDV